MILKWNNGEKRAFNIWRGCGRTPRSPPLPQRYATVVRSKLPNCKLAISNVIARKDKNEIDKKVETFNIKLSKFCKKNKIEITDNKNLDDSRLNYKQLHLNRKGDSYLANSFLDYLDCVWHEKMLLVSNSSNVSSIKGLYSLRKRYPLKYNHFLPEHKLHLKQIKWAESFKFWLGWYSLNCRVKARRVILK